jgi:hypothetical protein
MPPTRLHPGHARRTIVLAALLLTPLLLAGCDEDPATGPLLPGVIQITVSPAGMPLPWELTGPDGYATSGAGARLLGGLEPGAYRITWLPVPARLTPLPREQDLVAGRIVTFLGRYDAIELDSADAVVRLLVDSHEAMDADLYRSLLHPQFRFVPQGDAAPWDAATERAIMARLLGQVPGEDGLAIGAISVDGFEPQGVWQPIAPGDPHFGDDSTGLFRDYSVDIALAVAGTGLVWRVRGPVIIYAEPVLEDGIPGWRLLGMVDLTAGGKATETITWTRLKQRFD